MESTPPDPLIHATLPQHSSGALFFGGSFDPPHRGHALLPQKILEALGREADNLVYVPAARSPHKDSVPTPAEHRIAMLRLMLPTAPSAWIWTEEIDRARANPEEPSYWAKTWARVRDAYGSGRARFLIGADQAVSMHRWYEHESIWRDAVVMLRDEHDAPDQLIESLKQTGAWSEQDLDRWRGMIVPVPTIDASSTAIRGALADPSARKNPIAGLDDRVRDYILEHGLYLS